MSGSELELLLRGLTGAVGTREGSCSPGTAATNFGEVGEEGEGGLVAEWDVDEAVVSKSAHSVKSSGLLSSTEGSGRDEETSIFAYIKGQQMFQTLKGYCFLTPESTSLPLTSSRVPESLPLSWEGSISGWDTEEESIVLLELRWAVEGWDLAVLLWSVHLGQDFLWESLWDTVKVDRAACGLDALGLGLSELLDVTPGGVLVVVSMVDTTSKSS